MVSIAARFEPFYGRYMYHCHVVEHEDNDMMRPFVVAPEMGMGMEAMHPQHRLPAQPGGSPPPGPAVARVGRVPDTGRGEQRSGERNRGQGRAKRGQEPFLTIERTSVSFAICQDYDERRKAG